MAHSSCGSKPFSYVLVMVDCADHLGIEAFCSSDQVVHEAACHTNLLFAEDVDGLARQERELVKLVNHLEAASTAYVMQISAEKIQLMTNNTNGISTGIAINKLETVRSPKYSPG